MVKIDVVLTENEVAFVNHSTKCVFNKIPRENFDKNRDGCLEELFTRIIDYINKDCEVKFIIQKTEKNGKNTTIKLYESYRVIS